MSREAKIGLAAVALVLVAVLWFRGGEPEHPAGLPRVEKPASQSQPAGGSAFERLPGSNPRERLQRMRDRDLPTPPAGDQVTGRARPRVLPPPDLAEDVDDIDPDDFESLSKMALHDEDPDNRIVAAWLLASLEEEPVIPVLAKVLNDPDPEVRLAAVESLSDLTDIEENPPIDLLSQALDDPDPEVRFEALSLVTEIGDTRMQPLVEKALQDEDEDVRSLAESAAELEDIYKQAPPAQAGAAVE